MFRPQDSEQIHGGMIDVFVDKNIIKAVNVL